MAEMDKIAQQVDVRSDDGWQDLLNWLPAGWEEKMVELGGFARSRLVRSPGDLLRITFAFAVLGLHLEGLAAWCREKLIASCSHVALWRRLARMAPFLEWLVAALLRETVAAPRNGLVLAPLDATTFSLPGSTKRDWLVHLLWASGNVHDVRVTRVQGEGTGESLLHLKDLPADAVVLADRAYGTPPGIIKASRQERRFILRFTWNNLPLYLDREGGARIDAKQALGTLRTGNVGEFFAWVRSRKEEPVRVRVVATRLDNQKAEAARKHSQEESTRKGHKPNATTGFVAGFVLLVTNVKISDAPARAVADAYRWRWQIELEFKRLKSITGVRRLDNWKDEMVKCYLLALIAAWLLTHKIARTGAFFPWGYPLAWPS